MEQLKFQEKSFNVFNLVKSNEKMTIKELGELTGLTPAQVGGTLIHMITKGLVSRFSEGEGKDKVAFVAITDLGRETEVVQAEA